MPEQTFKTKYMMATAAIHQTGDISRDTPDLCIVYNEDEENYIGDMINERSQSAEFPFTYDGWNLVWRHVIKYYDVEFTADFGSIKQGQKFDSVATDISNSTLVCYDEQRFKLQEVKYKCVAI